MGFLDSILGGAGGAVAGPVADILGGLIGAGASSADRQKAGQAAQDAYNQLINIGTPPDMAKSLIYKQYSQAGQLTPEIEQAIKLGPSAVAGIQEDSSLRNAQMNALHQLSNQSKTGMGMQDIAALNQARAQVGAATQGKTQQILQEAQARGQGGQGASLIAQLNAAQQGSNQLSQAGNDAAASAAQRALQALSQYGTQSGQVRNQDFSNNLARSQAQDQFNRFNTENLLAQQQRNIASKNNAQQFNLVNAQNISNANTGLVNSAMDKAYQGQQTNWNNNLTAADTRSRGYKGLSDYYNGQANQTANQWNNIAGGVSSGLGGLADYYNKTQMKAQNDANTSADDQKNAAGSGALAGMYAGY